MIIDRDLPSERLVATTKAYRRSVWKRIAVAVVLGGLVTYMLSELARGAF